MHTPYCQVRKTCKIMAYIGAKVMGWSARRIKQSNGRSKCLLHAYSGGGEVGKEGAVELLGQERKSKCNKFADNVLVGS